MSVFLRSDLQPYLFKSCVRMCIDHFKTFSKFWSPFSFQLGSVQQNPPVLSLHQYTKNDVIMHKREIYLHYKSKVFIATLLMSLESNLTKNVGVVFVWSAIQGVPGSAPLVNPGCYPIIISLTSQVKCKPLSHWVIFEDTYNPHQHSLPSTRPQIMCYFTWGKTKWFYTTKLVLGEKNSSVLGNWISRSRYMCICVFHIWGVSLVFFTAGYMPYEYMNIYVPHTSIILPDPSEKGQTLREKLYTC